MFAQTTSAQPETLLERFGAYPAVLILIAFALGVSAIIRRHPRHNLFVGVGVLSIALLGMGCTAWRLYACTATLMPGGYPDPSMWIMDQGHAWAATGIVMPVCGFSGILLAIAYLLTNKSDD